MCCRIEEVSGIMLDDPRPRLRPDLTNRGLSSEEAARLLTELGPNEFVERRESPLCKVLGIV